MNMDKIIGWGIIGLGRIAGEFAECLRLVPGNRVAAAGSRSLEKAKAFTEKHGGKPYGSYREMVEDHDVDMVYVATPHNIHEENVIMSADAGKGVLCEKPFTVTFESAQRMIDAAKKNNVFIMEGLWARFFPVWQKAFELIDSGVIGEIRVIESAMSWGNQVAMPENRLYAPELAGGSILDAGAYPLSAAFSIMKGKLPAEIKGVYHLCETGVDDDAAVLFRYENPDVLALLRCGLRSTGFDTHIIGGKGTLVVERHDHPSRLIHKHHEQGVSYPRQEEIIEIPFRSYGFQYEIKAVADCFLQGKKECETAPWKQTLDMARISENIRHEAGVRYPWEASTVYPLE
jgi:predicted dehydrogenase